MAVTPTSTVSLATRLDYAGNRIDDLAQRATGCRPETRTRVERRVDALRAQAAVARRDLRTSAAEGGSLCLRLLDGRLDEMDIELAIADSQLEVDRAAVGTAFEAAVRRQIDAYNAHVERIMALAARGQLRHRTQLEAIAASVRESKIAATQRLNHYSEASAEASRSLRDEVLTALDDLDRAVAGTRIHDH